MTIDVEAVKAKAREGWAKGGKPTKHPWSDLRGEIEAYIAQGWSVTQLARHYDVTYQTMHRQLKALSLKTLWAQQ